MVTNFDVGTVVAFISLIGVVFTSYLSNRGKNAEIKASGMNDLNDALQEELKRKQTENDRLEALVEQLRQENGTLRSLLQGKPNS